MAERVLTLNGMRNLTEVVWAESGKDWYITEKTPLDEVLSDVDRDGHSWELLTSPSLLWAVPSPDGRRIAYPMETISSNVWAINGF